MKPANFPARKAARRAGALRRLGEPFVRPDGSVRDPATVNAEILTLHSRLQGNERDHRSKKPRGSRRGVALTPSPEAA